jgi:hypothetical protein
MPSFGGKTTSSMKTLQGIELEGELLTLYRYHFAPDGGAVEADLMAQAVGLREDLKILLSMQGLYVNLATKIIFNIFDDGIQKMAAVKSNLPSDYMRFYHRGLLTEDAVLRHHANNNEYLFPYIFCSMPIYVPSDGKKPSEFAEEVSFSRPNDDGQSTTVFLPLDSPMFPPNLKTHPYYLKAAEAIKYVVQSIYLKLSRYHNTIDLSQVLIQTNHPLLGTLDHTILQ